MWRHGLNRVFCGCWRFWQYRHLHVNVPVENDFNYMLYCLWNRRFDSIRQRIAEWIYPEWKTEREYYAHYVEQWRNPSKRSPCFKAAYEHLFNDEIDECMRKLQRLLIALRSAQQEHLPHGEEKQWQAHFERDKDRSIEEDVRRAFED